jgi:hypothetical protein
MHLPASLKQQQATGCHFTARIKSIQVHSTGQPGCHEPRRLWSCTVLALQQRRHDTAQHIIHYQTHESGFRQLELEGGLWVERVRVT